MTRANSIVNINRWICPVYLNRPTKMLKSSFIAQCLSYQKRRQDEEDGIYEKINVGRYRPNCISCVDCKYGEAVSQDKLKNPPPDMEWVTLSSYNVQPAKVKAKSKAKSTQSAATLKVQASVAQTKMTAEKVKEIRRLHARKTYTRSKLANMFSTSNRNIGHIINRDTWKHV